MEATTTPPPQHDAAASDLPDASKVAVANNQHSSSVNAPANALTPPTSEDLNGGVNMDDGSSDLSDLDFDEEEEEETKKVVEDKEEDDDDDDDGEEIVPDHYYEGGKIPVFKPVCFCEVPRQVAFAKTCL